MMLNIAHRGASADAPENTLSAFRLAEAAGADGIELDVQLSRDGRLAVFHDETLERTSNGHGRLADADWADLSRLDAGAWFHPRFAGERIPTLDQVLEIGPASFWFDIEIKDDGDGGRAAASAVLRLLRLRGMGGRSLITSFNPNVLAYCRQVDPGIPTGLIFAGQIPANLLSMDLEVWGAQADLITPLLIESAREKGVQIFAWTVDEPEKMSELFFSGIDGIITNRPQWAADLILAKMVRPKK